MPKESSKSFQSIILALQSFWAERGCVIWQPYHTEVGAGTLNPATALRVLGPEPWRVAYVEPSIRPADGRYGENPNRWQHFYQFQVILKPDPGNPQELFLESLVALGFNPLEHDIRFVEDNWEAPALGAWGLGWEVWLDGQEITQFTYFQQSGGQTLDPVSVEITYGIERIALALQGVSNFLDLGWTSDRTYGDIYFQSEREFSRYNFELADVERLRTIYAEFEAEAEAALNAGLIYPAHDYILKCSHTFNILDARGAVGVTERAALFGRMRDLARRVSEAYISGREALGFPWLAEGVEPIPEESLEGGEHLTAPANFLLEIGTEELPAADLQTALEQLEVGASSMLAENRLQHGQVRVMGTPRRLVVYMAELMPRQADQVTVVRGPPADRAFDPEGKPTKAAVGFAASRGIEVRDLKLKEVDGGRYVVAEVHEPGRPALDVLSRELPALIAKVQFDKSMRWDETGATFSRPIRWLLALHGQQVVPFTYAGLQAGRQTRGVRFHAEDCQSVAHAADYFNWLEEQGVVLDVAERRAEIRRQAGRLAAEIDGGIYEDPELLAEVTNLVEAPIALRGQFDEHYLELPRQVLVAVMKEQQRYFPVEANGDLLPYFVALRNGGTEHLDIVTQGNENVLEARFADAEYFIGRDLEEPLEAYLPRLASLTFHAQLGSMLEKVHRVETLVAQLASDFDLEGSQLEHALRAAQLCKADLSTLIVREMTSLQGVMGRQYALQAGEPPEVAEAIYEHYLPRTAEDDLPTGQTGIVLGIADRLDTLMGLFATGITPTGGGDPFGLRRAALGLIQVLVARSLPFDLRRGLRLAGQGLPFKPAEEAFKRCLEFIRGRQQRLLRAAGFRHDVVAAVLEEQGHDPAGTAQAAEALGQWTARSDWSDYLNAYARCARITRGAEKEFSLDPALLSEAAETTLFEALQVAEGSERRLGSVGGFFAAFEPLVPAINTFFDEVLVMVEAPELRNNRLALLQRIVKMAQGVADLSKLEGF